MIITVVDGPLDSVVLLLMLDNGSIDIVVIVSVRGVLLRVVLIIGDLGVRWDKTVISHRVALNWGILGVHALRLMDCVIAVVLLLYVVVVLVHSVVVVRVVLVVGLVRSIKVVVLNDLLLLRVEARVVAVLVLLELVHPASSRGVVLRVVRLVHGLRLLVCIVLLHVLVAVPKVLGLDCVDGGVATVVIVLSVPMMSVHEVV
mmetsp:Transcript_1001/g.1638  ORF Transcript_1001/g.1638 Transcript_1001/m.1638 type:complete len:202 (-) Transcript_1001:549-1154(-)